MLDLTAGSLNHRLYRLARDHDFLRAGGDYLYVCGGFGTEFVSLVVWCISDFRQEGDRCGGYREKLFAGRNQPELHFYFAGAFACGDAYGAICADSGAWLSDKGGGFIDTAFVDLYWLHWQAAAASWQLFKEKMALEISVVKMIGMPALAILAMLFIPADGLAKSVFLLSVCMPSAAVVPMMVGRYGYGDKMSSDIVLWTTVLSMATLPLSVLLAAKLYGAV